MQVRPFEGDLAAAAQLLAAMGNECRLTILCALIAGERRVGDLAQNVGVSQSALSQHLAKLRRAGVVRTRRSSRAVFYALAGTAPAQVLAALAQAAADDAATPAGDPAKRRRPHDPAPLAPRRPHHAD